MSRKGKISGPEKIAAIEKYLRGEDSLNHLATLLDVSYQSIKQWFQTYPSLGPGALLNTSKNTAYPSLIPFLFFWFHKHRDLYERSALFFLPVPIHLLVFDFLFAVLLIPWLPDCDCHFPSQIRYH